MEKKRLGFTLIELAVIMAIMGAVTGGIYVAASAVNATSKQNTFEAQLLHISTAVRKAYSGKSSIPANINANLKTYGIVPPGATVTGSGATTTIQGPYGPVLVYGGGVGPGPVASQASGFYIAAQNVPYAACMDFLLNFANTKRAKDLQGIYGIGVKSAPNLPVTGQQLYVGNQTASTINQTNADIMCSHYPGGGTVVAYYK